MNDLENHFGDDASLDEDVNKNILTLIDKLISLPDLFSKSEAILNSVQNSNISNFSNNFATNLNPLLTALKESLQAINPKNTEIQNQINSLIKKVENIIQEYTNNNCRQFVRNLKFLHISYQIMISHRAKFDLPNLHFHQFL